VFSEDTIRRALKAIDATQGTTWLDDQIRYSTEHLLDIDTTIKPLYGHQQGAVVSCNPLKPGRPSHSCHTYLIAGLRLVLGMEVKADAGQGWEGLQGDLALLGW
jgi:hypothetical protein